MNIDKAKKVTKLTNEINKCVSVLAKLDGRSYSDEFTIYYRGLETCELEESALNILIEYYKKRLLEAEQQLERL